MESENRENAGSSDKPKRQNRENAQPTKLTPEVPMEKFVGEGAPRNDLYQTANGLDGSPILTPAERSPGRARPPQIIPPTVKYEVTFNTGVRQYVDGDLANAYRGRKNVVEIREYRSRG